MLSYRRSERPFERELHDSRILGAENSSEGVRIVQRCAGVVHANTVQHIKGFRADFELLPFAERERARERGIQLPEGRTQHGPGAQVAKRPGSRLSEGHGIQPGQAWSDV